MVKQRFLALFLAVMMIFSSLTVYADNTQVLDSSQVLETESAVQDENVITDEVVSGGSAGVSGDANDLDRVVGKDGWELGMTGGYKDSLSKGGTFEVNGDTVSKKIIAADRGKWGIKNGAKVQDQYPYYYAKDGVGIDEDFTFKATMVVDSANEGVAKNQNQSAAGLTILGAVGLTKEEEKSQGVPAVSAYTYIEKTPDSKYTLAIRGAYKYSVADSVTNREADIKMVTEDPQTGAGKELIDLSEVIDVTNGKKNLGPYDIVIKKVGNVYNVSCTENGVTKSCSIAYDKANYAVSADADGNPIIPDKIYPAVFCARNMAATFTNISLEVDDFSPVSMTMTKAPESNKAIYGNNPTFEGMELEVLYKNPAGEERKETFTSGYTIENYDSKKLGEQTINICIGNVSVSYTVNVVSKVTTDINVLTPPFKTIYYVGEEIDVVGLKIQAVYDDGLTPQLSRDEYDLYIDNKLIDGTQKQYITKEMIGNKKVVVKRKGIEGIEQGDAEGSFDITVTDAELTNIVVGVKPAKVTYYIGDKLDLSGMVVKAYYKTADGAILTDNLQESEYSATKEIDTSTVGKREIVVTLNANENLTAKFNVEVTERILTNSRMTGWPLTTYPLVTSELMAEASQTSYEPKFWYDYFNGTGTKEDGNAQYNMGNLEISYIYSNGDIEVANPNDYEIDLSNFKINELVNKTPENENAGSKIVINFKDGTEAKNNSLKGYELPVTVSNPEEEQEYNWRPAVFGSATNFGKADSPCKLWWTDNYAPVNAPEMKDESHKEMKLNQRPYKETNTDILTDGKAIHLMADKGSGKQADSNDGIVYFYTRLKTSDHFKISADFYINNYVQNNDDEARDGQEGFGIMARDVIPLAPADGGKTYAYTADKAVLDPTTGEPEPLSTGSYSYANMVFVGGHSGSGFPSDPTASNYLFNSTKNRINLIYRTFIEEPYSASANVKRSSVQNTISENFPKIGDKYRLSLESINGGYAATCYDYQNGVTKRDFFLYDKESEETGLDVIDPDYFYLGFFTARYGDVVVSNVDLIKVDPTTNSQNYVSDIVKTVTPTLSLMSNTVTNKTNYNLALRANNKSGGYVTIKQGDKLVYKDYFVAKKNVSFPIELEANTDNKFTVMFTPRVVSEYSEYYEPLSSTDSKTYTWTVRHTSFNSKDTFIYAAPDGNSNAAGTIDDPLNFDTAIALQDLDQTVVLLPGTYYRTEPIKISEAMTGLKNNPKALVGYNPYYANIAKKAKEAGEEYNWFDDYELSDSIEEGPVVFNFQTVSQGLESAASYFTMKDFAITNCAYNVKPFHVGGSYNLIQNIKSYGNKDSGIGISRVNSNQENINQWPTGNLLLNCESYNNADASHNNADGYAMKLTIGYGNVCDGCIAHHISDDGWDLFCKQSGGYIAPVTLKNCTAYKIGYQLLDDGTEKLWDTERGGRNGFKMGGDLMPIDHVMIGCKAFDNGNMGITSNSNPLMTIRDTVSYNNGLNNSKAANVTLSSNSKQSEMVYDVMGLVSDKNNNNDSIGKGWNGTAEDEDYNFLIRSKTSKNKSGDTKEKFGGSFFVSEESPVVNGKIPQDEDGKFNLNGFLDLKPEVLDYIHSCEGYNPSTIYDSGYKILKDYAIATNRVAPKLHGYDESLYYDIDEPTETTTKPVEEDNDRGPVRGSGGGSSSSSSKDKTETNKTDKDKTDNTKQEDSKTEDNKKENTGTDNTPVKVEKEKVKDVKVTDNELEKADNKITVDFEDSNVANVSVPKTEKDVIIKAGNAEVSLTKGAAKDGLVVQIKKAEVLPEAVQVKAGDTAVAVSVKDEQGKEVKLDNYIWTAINYSKDVTNPEKVIVASVDGNGNMKVIRASFYDKVTKKVMFPMLESGVFAAYESEVSFDDVTDHWAKVYINTLAAREIINGIGNNMFAPDQNIKKGDFIKILVGILDIKATSNSTYSDVSTSDYYSEQIAAAKEYGILDAFSGSTLGAKDNATREEVMVMIAKTMKLIKGESVQKADLSKFSDSDQISDYAKDSVAELVGMGIIEGSEGKLNPKSELTRAEATKLLYSVWENY